MEKVVLKIVCPFCGERHGVAVPESEYDAWRFGELAQVAFKSLNATQREQIISGMCPRCQASIFGEEDK